MPDEKAHFATEHSLEFNRSGEGKIKINYKQEDDGGRPMKVLDDFIKIIFMRVYESQRQVFKYDRWVNLGNDRVSKNGPTLILKKEDAEDLLQDLIDVLRKNCVISERLES